MAGLTSDGLDTQPVGRALRLAAGVSGVFLLGICLLLLSSVAQSRGVGWLGLMVTAELLVAAAAALHIARTGHSWPIATILLIATIAAIAASAGFLVFEAMDRVSERSLLQM